VKFYEVTEGSEFQSSLDNLQLDFNEEEDLREALDWQLSKNPEKGRKINTDVMTIFLESYLTVSGRYILVTYRIEGETVVLEQVDWDISQDF
jgi:hypothetical protein